MQPCHTKPRRRPALALPMLAIAFLALALVAVPAAADSPLRPAPAPLSAPLAAAIPEAAPAATADGVRRVFARATAACTGGLVYDDGEIDEAISFRDPGNDDLGLAADAVMRFDAGSSGNFLEQLCVCWNRENPTAPDLSTFEHDLLLFRANGPLGSPGSVIAVIPAELSDPPNPLQTVFFEYDLSDAAIEIPDSTFYAGVRWRSADSGNQGLRLCIDQDGLGSQPMWLRVAPPNPTPWSTTNEVFADSEVVPPTALMIRAELSTELPVETCPATPCVPDVDTLCLNDGRFRVEADWRTNQGTSGPAMAGDPLTDDTGYFWFFNAQNVEMVVKVLDACGVNGRYWVFAGGLTNVEVEMRVCDTLEGLQETYFNPLNTRFQPIQDTDAFATCP